MHDLLLAVDAGSSSLKVALYDQSGALVARRSAGYAYLHSQSDRVEQDPDHWITLLVGMVRSFWESGIDSTRVAGIGLSGRGGGAIFLDNAGSVLLPVWFDNRARDAGRALQEMVGDSADYQTRGLAGKTFYIRRAHPAQFARLAHALFIKDFLLYRLTGEVATDPSSGPASGAWSQGHWDAVGLPIERLPPIRPHTEIGGVLTTSAARALGLADNLLVGVGGHDGACANIGAGAIQPGDVCLTMGTQGVVRSIAATLPDHLRDRRVSPYRFLPGRWFCSCDLVLAGSLATINAALLQEAPWMNDDPHVDLTRGASTVPPGSNGVTYIPFPDGQISPEYRPNAHAAFLGLRAHTTRFELYRATLEGGAVAFRSAIDRQREVGLAPKCLRVSGGGARNTLWLQILADTLNSAIEVVEPDEGARGAAALLAVALGWFPDTDVAVKSWIHPVRTVEPSLNQTCYERLYKRARFLADAVYQAENVVGT